MGLLDDAIREHLDLKRRRGADPAEIERAEKEALGPVRRGPGGRAPTDDDLADAIIASGGGADLVEHLDWPESRPKAPVQSAIVDLGPPAEPVPSAIVDLGPAAGAG